MNLRVPILCVLCKGWDTRTFVSRFVDPTLRKMREGWGTRRLVALPAEDRFISTWVGNAGGQL
jgi:hypothetical protein